MLSLKAMMKYGARPARFGDFATERRGWRVSVFFCLIVAIGDGIGQCAQVVSWGSDEHGQSTVPSNLSNVVQVAAGAAHSLALKSDGTAGIWGKIYDGNSYIDATLPVGLTNVVAISAGFFHNLALKSDGKVVGWGYDGFGAASGGSGLSNIVAITANADQSLAFRLDGSIAAWGRATAGSTQVPGWLTNVAAISAGQVHNLVLLNDGTVIGWGANYSGQATGVPTPTDAGNPYGSSTGIVTIAGQVLTNVVAVSGGGNHSLALKSDGTVVAWGTIGGGPFKTNAYVPLGLSNVVAISAGFDHDIALLSDHTVTAWGLNTYNQTNIPLGLSNVVAVAGGYHHTLAVVALAPVIITQPPSEILLSLGTNLELIISH